MIIGIVVGVMLIFIIPITIIICSRFSIVYSHYFQDVRRKAARRENVRRGTVRNHIERIQREQPFRQENGLEIQPFQGNPQPQVQMLAINSQVE